MMNNPKILIVEDELLIATYIQGFLSNNGFDVVDIAVSYDEAITILDSVSIDFVLLDINISGDKTGVDVANYINETSKVPFIYLTSYTDSDSIADLKRTKPVGFQPKPIHQVALLTALELYFENNESNCTVSVESGAKTYNFHGTNILYIQASHIYTVVHTIDEEFVIRITLKKFLESIPNCCPLVRINRSTAVNLRFIDQKNKKSVTISGKEFMISKSYAPTL